MTGAYTGAVAFSNKTPPPGDLRAKGTSWAEACGALTSQLITYLGGWKKAPSTFGPAASNVAAKSKILSKDYSKAPVLAFHFFKIAGSTSGHVMTDLNGGGTDCASASGRAAKRDLGNFFRIQSVPGYIATGGITYLGWSTDYAGGIPNYVEPSPVTIAPNERVTGVKGANVRALPSTDSPALTPLKGNLKVAMSGFIRGVVANGSPNWFVHAFGVSHVSGFVDQGTHDLPDRTPPPVVTWNVIFTGDGAPVTQTVVSGAKAAQPTNPAREGSSFLGWRSAATGLLWSFDTPVTSTVTLSAVFEVIMPKETGWYLDKDGALWHFDSETNSWYWRANDSGVERSGYEPQTDFAPFTPTSAPVVPDPEVPDDDATPGWFSRFIQTLVEAFQKFLGR